MAPLGPTLLFVPELKQAPARKEAGDVKISRYNVSGSLARVLHANQDNQWVVGLR